jgi:CsoR family transcriptional regulator, copper-sensing transcriptional repressor
MTKSEPHLHEMLSPQGITNPILEDVAHGDHSHDAEGLAEHPHVHSEESLRRIVNRLSRIEGHVRGIKAMVQESRACPDVLVQLAAVRGAVDRVARMILDEHLTQCVARAALEGNIEVEIEELKAALDRFLP